MSKLKSFAGDGLAWALLLATSGAMALVAVALVWLFVFICGLAVPSMTFFVLFFVVWALATARIYLTGGV